MKRCGALLLQPLRDVAARFQARPRVASASPDIAKPTLRISGAMLSDVGRIRSNNEDTVAYVAPDPGAPEHQKGFLALVADGMGGHAAGEIASFLAAETIRDVVYRSDAPAPQALAAAFDAANVAIRDHARRNPETEGMGTTCTALLTRDGELFMAHVGDSRAYLLRDGALTQLSDDQTLHAHLIQQGLMTAQEAAEAPGGNYILQALGVRDAVSPSIFATGLPLQAGDRLALCSDGLHVLVDDAVIAAVIAAEAPHEACRQLVEAANAAGGHDNISVGVFHVDPPGIPSTDHAQTKPIAAASPHDETAERSSRIPG